MFDTLPANEQYDYVFEGNAQTLDHILVTPALKPVRRRSTSSTSTPSTATSSATTTPSCSHSTSAPRPADGSWPPVPTG